MSNNELPVNDPSVLSSAGSSIENLPRRNFLKTATQSAAALPISALTLSALTMPGLSAMVNAAEKSDSLKAVQAMAFLDQVLSDHDAAFATDEWHLDDDNDRAEGRLMLLNTLSHALDAWLHADAARPVFKRWHNPEKKLLGDNPDSLYYDAPASAEHSYRITGNIDGATYTSFTVEIARGGASGKLGAVLNDDQFTIEDDGSYEIIASAKKPTGDLANKNWLQLAPNARSITTRHYFETQDSVSADRLKNIPLLIENLVNSGPAPRLTEDEIAGRIMRAAHWLKATVFPPSAERSPHWVSRVPNQFSPPKVDATNQAIGYAAKDNTYAMTWFDLQPNQALIIRGRWPKCRFANVVLQNLFMQTLDYVYRNISLNRTQAVVDKDGNFEMIVAAKDPGKPNWLDTEGRQRGVIFCRFQLVKGDLAPLTTELVDISTLA